MRLCLPKSYSLAEVEKLAPQAPLKHFNLAGATPPAARCVAWVPKLPPASYPSVAEIVAKGVAKGLAERVFLISFDLALFYFVLIIFIFVLILLLLILTLFFLVLTLFLLLFILFLLLFILLARGQVTFLPKKRPQRGFFGTEGLVMVDEAMPPQVLLAR